MTPLVLDRVINSDAMIRDFSLPQEWRGRRVELRLLSSKPKKLKKAFESIPVGHATGDTLDMLREMRDSRF